MSDNYHYAYITGATLFAIPWLAIFLFRPDLRREMLTMSLVNSLYGFTEHLYYGEYWHPVLVFKLPGLNAGLDSIYLMFIYGGLGAAIYKFVFHKKVTKADNLTFKSGARVVIFVSLCEFMIFGILKITTSMNVIYPSIIACFFTGICFMLYRRDLALSSLISMLLFASLSLLTLAFFTLLFPGIIDVWWSHALSGIRLWGVPIEEVFWHAGIGLFGACIYEVWHGYKIVPFDKTSSDVAKINARAEQSLI